MSLEAVKIFFSQHNIADRIIVLENSTATVEEAAKAHQVDPDQIGKTLSFRLEDKAILVVVAGRSKIDNRKFKKQFSSKAKMLNPDEVLEETGHAIGGVCPFGLKNSIDVYLDVSLKKNVEIIPAAGDQYSAIRLTIDELEKYSDYKTWVDISK